MIKAIFFDIDGTLLSFKTHKVATSTIEALHELRKKGIKLFIATGRHKSEANKINEYFKFDAYITLNGQYCFNDDEIIYKKCIDNDDISNIVKQVENDHYSCYFVTEDEIFINKINDDVINICSDLNVNMPKVCEPSTALSQKIYQLIAVLSKEKEHLLLDNAPNIEGTRWHDNFMDVLPKGGSKQVGIGALLSHYDICKNEIMAFGNGENDISMLSFAKIGVAMGNASDYVKKHADYITTDIDDDGIYNALKHFKVL